MDEYTLEIQQINRRIAAVRAAPDGGDPVLLGELEDERNILRLLYQKALALEERGEQEAGLRASLARLGFAPWGLKAAYDFIYELVEQIPVPPGRDPSGVLRAMRALDPVAELETQLAKRGLS